MRRVIYRTEYFEQGGKFLREEEYDAYFHTIPQKGIVDAEQKSLNGCKLLHPKHVPSRLTKEQWDVLLSKKPGCQLLYASLYDVSDTQYAIFSMYEQKMS
jgi:hypothetical protein